MIIFIMFVYLKQELTRKEAAAAVQRQDSLIKVMIERARDTSIHKHDKDQPVHD